jgi:hypothetical protein
MADNKRWFKVWTSILSDPGLQVIPLEDWGRWIKLMALTAMHGENGNVTVPVTYLQQQLCIKDLMCVALPNIEIESDDVTVTVTIKNWAKYQAFSESYERVQKFREKQKAVTVTNVTNPLPDKIRRDKKRIEKKLLKDILSEHEKTFCDAYPGINLQNETAKAQAWLDSNPKNKKSNLKRFLNNWFNRAQENINRFPAKEDKFL